MAAFPFLFWRSALEARKRGHLDLVCFFLRRAAHWNLTGKGISPDDGDVGVAEEEVVDILKPVERVSVEGLFPDAAQVQVFDPR